MKSHIFKNTLSKLVPSLALISFISSGCAAHPVRTLKRAIDASKARILTFESDANGFNTKTFFYDNGEEVVAIDLQFTEELAEKAIDFLKSQTSSKLTYAIITHPNPDKFNGLRVFQKHGAKVIASAETAKNLAAVHAYKKYYFVGMTKMFTEASYPKLGKPDFVFDQDHRLQLKNGELIELQKLSQAGVSTDQTVVFVPTLNALFVGDLVHHKAHAWLEGGIVNGKPVPNLSAWQQSLDEVQQLFASANPTIYGGRGQSVPLEVGVKEQVHYLQTADKIVRDFLAGSPVIRRELKTEQAATHYKTLQKIFESQFPEYSLGYMIQYGAYGLVESKL